MLEPLTFITQKTYVENTPLSPTTKISRNKQLVVVVIKQVDV